MGVSESGFYEWLNRKSSPTKRKNDEPLLIRELKIQHKKAYRSYGTRRHLKDLAAKGHKVGRHRIRRLMTEAEVVAKQKRAYRVTTNSNHQLPVAPNVVARNFSPQQPNQVWVGDLTYIPTSQGWLYLVVILDCFSRRVVGWSMSSRPSRHVVLEALRHAIKRRGVRPSLVFHSDRGIQYASKDYRSCLERNGIIASMSRKGNCWDNAVAESFFATLEKELLVDIQGCTKEEARNAIFKYVETFYNCHRRHSTIGYQSPSYFEAQYHQQNEKEQRKAA
jgi:putative transposase